MKMDIFSEQDLQDYACGSFSGNRSGLEQYLNEHPEALQLVREYQKIYNVIKMETDPSMSFDLANKVAQRIEEKKSGAESRLFQLFTSVLLVFTIGVLNFIIRDMNWLDGISSSLDVGLFLLSIVVMIFFAVLFYRLELRQRENLFLKQVSEQDS